MATQDAEVSSATVSVVSEAAALLVASRAALRELTRSAATALAAPAAAPGMRARSVPLTQEHLAVASAALRHGSCLQVGCSMGCWVTRCC